MTVPSQSMTIKQIVEKFVKNIPIDIKQRQAVFVSDNDRDLEKLGRLDPADAAYEAAVMRGHNERVRDAFRESERAKNERKTKEEAELKAKQAAAAAEPSKVNP